MQPAEPLLKVRAGALDIAYRDAGSGPPVLFINGSGESGATWDRQVAVLASRYRCVAIDQRDTGDSSYVTSSYTPRDLASDAAAVIEALSLGPCHVVGYSLGGAVAQELSLARPDLVRSLVLLSTWAATDPWFAAQMRNWQAIRRAYADNETAFLDALSPWLFSPATFATPGAVDAIYDHAAAIETLQRPDGFLRQCDADIVHDSRARLGSITVPALVIVGADDICTPPHYAAELCALIAGARLVTIPDAAHCAVFERPDMVSKAIEGFLSEV